MSPGLGGLKVRGLRVVRGGRTVVDGLDLDVAPGSVVGLLGPNGAGKSSAFLAIAGLVPRAAGTVSLGGVDLGDAPLWARVRSGLGYLPQGASVLRRLSVRDNLRLVDLGAATPPAVEAALDAAGLRARADAPAVSLSGGERRRLELARALMARPQVLLLDEPFSGVDPVAIDDLSTRLRALRATGLGILLTDHAVQDALPLCDEVCVLDGGAVLARGHPAAIAANARVVERYLGGAFRARSGA